MNIAEYIRLNYGGSSTWFVDEVRQSHHVSRVGRVLDNKNYLEGVHSVLNREDLTFKGQTYEVSKMVLNIAKSIILFHNSYLLGKRVSLSGSEGLVKEMDRVFRMGRFHNQNYKILDKVNKYGDAYEYIYIDGGKIKGKLINPEDGFPVYSDGGEYIAFIEYWADMLSNIEQYIVYYPDRVEKYSNEGGFLKLIAEYNNATGLPIHYKNGENEYDGCYGKSILEDIKPIISKIEFLLNKMDDSIYTLSLNPMPVAIGQKLDNSVNADAVGYVLNLDDGDFKYAACNLDSASIKLLYDSLMQQLMMTACVPAHIFGQNNVSNVSEVSLQMLYQNLDNKARDMEVYIREGFEDRFDMIIKAMQMQGKKVGIDEYVDVEFNYNRPVNNSELLEQMERQYGMGAISRKTIIEKSEITNNVSVELERIEQEGSSSGGNVDGKVDDGVVE